MIRSLASSGTVDWRFRFHSRDWYPRPNYRSSNSSRNKSASTEVSRVAAFCVHAVQGPVDATDLRRVTAAWDHT